MQFYALLVWQRTPWLIGLLLLQSVSSFIILMSMFLGTLLPILLERLNLDPAHSAAPFLATLMDILGVAIYCYIVSQVLG